MSDPPKDQATTSLSSLSPPTVSTPPSSRSKLCKSPHIPKPDHATQSESDDEGEDEQEEEEENDDVLDSDSEDDVDSAPILVPSSLGLNHIRTRSAPSPLRFTSFAAYTPPNLGIDSIGPKISDPATTKSAFSHHPVKSKEQGRTDRFLFNFI